MEQAIERTPEGLIFEAVYAGVHQDCQEAECPCRLLDKPMRDPCDEEVATMRMVERGLTIREARATLYDW